jgi:energy-coupling factor transport system ATP-binding protein
VRDLWVDLGEREERTEALRGADLEIDPGERIALMGRNGAGKSTLLRAAAGLVEPQRGRIDAPRGAALLPQRPGDLFVQERVGDEVRGEAGRAALRRFGLEGLVDADPRELSGGERQRLALAIVAPDVGDAVAAGDDAAVVALDEPTRGMDRETKAALAAVLRRRGARGQAVLVATHDPEFACACAERVVLLADGRVIADGPAAELLAGGWYFATETARILGGAGGALRPEQGAELLGRVGR